MLERGFLVPEDTIKVTSRYNLELFRQLSLTKVPTLLQVDPEEAETGPCPPQTTVWHDPVAVTIWAADILPWRGISGNNTVQWWWCKGEI